MVASFDVWRETYLLNLIIVPYDLKGTWNNHRGIGVDFVAIIRHIECTELDDYRLENGICFDFFCLRC